MVRVDLSPVRQRLSARQQRRRRMRARAAARLQRLQQEQQEQQDNLRQLCVRRQQAVENWEREEKRLRRERKRKKKEDEEKEAADRRVVRFADEVFVTEIPVKPADPIPKPVASPIGVAVSDSAIARQRLDEIMADTKELDQLLADTTAPRLTRTTRFVPVDGNWGNLSDEEEDDDDDDDPEYDPSVDDESGGVKVTVVTPRKAQSVVVEVKVDKHSDCPPDRTLQQKKTKKRARTEPLDNEGSETPEHMPIESPAKEDAAETPLEGISSSRGSRKKKKRKTSHNQTASESLSPKAVTSVDASVSNEANGNASPSSGKKKRKRHQTNGSPSKSMSDEGLSEIPPQLETNGHAQKANTSDSEDEEELDNLFGDLVKQRAARKVKQLEQQEKEQQEKRPPKKVKNGAMGNHRSSPARYTKDGLRILTYDDIASDQPKGLNGACPFDCSCCF